MTEPATRECPAYPFSLRVIAVALVAALAFYAWRALPELRTAQWSFAGGATLVLAAVLIAWVAWWIVFSRTRLEGDEIVQTWLWDKRVKAQDVASFKLVYLRSLQAVVSPRLLVRRRLGGITWFHAADAELLMAFAAQVVDHQGNLARSPASASAA
ncbi:hypothetical protein [Hydrogenophaga laconesensis]|uniref:PH domain-containing protein n=1 Tax=Hydrogenophaga laconesensis TaxID=1805971 RepID=A0ABU1V9K5_9BURK|nr:hypothetical protein [Hydrogenophaga laconesensis]MDR7093898.1 hypothetical protein [Hydrogenophaga laconesensis]